MHVELKTARASLGRTDLPGDVIEVPDDEGGRLITSGQATLANAPADSNTYKPNRPDKSRGKR